MMKEKRIKKNIWMVLLIIVMVMLPILIKVMSNIPVLCELVNYEEHVVDVISFSVSIISAIGTILLGYVAYRQNKVANMQNERLIQLEETTKKVYVEIDKEKTTFTRTEDGYKCEIFGKNVSNVAIVNMEYDKAGKIVDKYDFKLETVRKLGVGYLSDYDANTIMLRVVDQYIDKEPFIFCFKLILTGLYGYKTVQTFNIIVKNNIIYEIYTVAE